MAAMAAALPYITAAASVASSIGQASAQEQVAKIEADQLRKQGIASQAESVQTAKFERKRAEQLQSRVKALAASSGSSISSPDIQNALSDIDEQGEYNALAALYTGKTASNSRMYAADVAIGRGKQAKSDGYTKSAGTILDFSAQKWG